MFDKIDYSIECIQLSFPKSLQVRFVFDICLEIDVVSVQWIRSANFDSNEKFSE